GAQTLVTSQGFFNGNVGGIALADNGTIYVGDADAFGGNGGIIGVNPITGSQSMIASGGFFIDPGELVVVPTPEPGTTVFLMLWAGVLLTRRRTERKREHPEWH